MFAYGSQVIYWKGQEYCFGIPIRETRHGCSGFLDLIGFFLFFYNDPRGVQLYTKRGSIGVKLCTQCPLLKTTFFFFRCNRYVGRVFNQLNRTRTGKSSVMFIWTIRKECDDNASHPIIHPSIDECIQWRLNSEFAAMWSSSTTTTQCLVWIIYSGHDLSQWWRSGWSHLNYIIGSIDQAMPGQTRADQSAIQCLLRLKLLVFDNRFLWLTDNASQWILTGWSQLLAWHCKDVTQYPR